jgi:hypothetical protein
VRRGWLAALAVAGGCAPEPPALPKEPVARAATCTAVRSLELRTGPSAQLSFAGFTEILHFAMIESARGRDAADLSLIAAISRAAPTRLQELEGQDWRGLVEPCNTSYPETQRAAAMPASSALEAGLTCFGIADFFARTAADHPQQAREAALLADRALAAATPALREQAAAGREPATLAALHQARAFVAGRPETLLAACRDRFPPLPAGPN